ncbi:hypothetical protein HZB01_04470 [Candidatus Woesearchaeota archaeon]|nr:hypothetical protein [Candidatus Woesearchaeota archaeon]
MQESENHDAWVESQWTMVPRPLKTLCAVAAIAITAGITYTAFSSALYNITREDLRESAMPRQTRLEIIRDYMDQYNEANPFVRVLLYGQHKAVIRQLNYIEFPRLNLEAAVHQLYKETSTPPSLIP